VSRGFTVKEIAAAVGVTEQAIRKQSQSWNGVRRPTGKGLMFPIEALPKKIQEKLHLFYGSPEDLQKNCLVSPIDLSKPIDGHEFAYVWASRRGFKVEFSAGEAAELYKQGHIDDFAIAYLFGVRSLAVTFPEKILRLRMTPPPPNKPASTGV
jgi:hypothetical protein